MSSFSSLIQVLEELYMLSITGGSFFSFLMSDSFSISHNFNTLSNYKVLFQDPASPMMEGIVHLHHDIIFLICVIRGVVSWCLFQSLYNFRSHKNTLASTRVHGTTLEIAWTIAPARVLIVIAIPTFALLYALDEGLEPAVTLKAVGHQWYWTYEYSDYSMPAQREAVPAEPIYTGIFKEGFIFLNTDHVEEVRVSVATGNIDVLNNYYSSFAVEEIATNDAFTCELECFMLQEADLEDYSQLRRLETDQPICLPVDTHVRIIVTAVDVLHCWTVPALGVKVDACPGRLNQISVFISKKGTFFGQCSELCGVNHAFMPIILISMEVEDYRTWIRSLYEDFF